MPPEVSEIAPSRWIGLLLATNVAVAGAVWWLRDAGPAREAEPSALLRPARGVLGPFPERRCQPVDYAGPQTRLYSDRPYATQQPVPALAGHRFCRGERHGQDLWILDVGRPTHLYTLAAARYALERAGWRLYPQPVRVDAEELDFDRLYQLRVEPGRYAIHYGHARTANPIFWNPRDARLLPLPTVRE
jgi:hypothetical protein